MSIKICRPHATGGNLTPFYQRQALNVKAYSELGKGRNEFSSKARAKVDQNHILHLEFRDLWNRPRPSCLPSVLALPKKGDATQRTTQSNSHSRLHLCMITFRKMITKFDMWMLHGLVDTFRYRSLLHSPMRLLIATFPADADRSDASK